MHYDDEQFRLRVRDDGKGIDPAAVASHETAGHFGLRGMTERAALIGGKLAVWSEVDEGTELELRLPAGAVYVAPGGRPGCHGCSPPGRRQDLNEICREPRPPSRFSRWTTIRALACTCPHCARPSQWTPVLANLSTVASSRS